MPNAYVSVAIMIAAYGNDLYDVLDVERDSDISGNETLTAKVSAANATVDMYLRKQYSLPLADVPDAINEAAQRIAWHALAGEHRSYTLSETDRNLYKDAMKLLQDLATGVAELDSGVEEPSPSVVLPAAVELGSGVPECEREGASNAAWFRNY